MPATINRRFQIALFSWYVLAVALPWTGIHWRTFSIPSGAALLLLTALIWRRESWRLAADEIVTSLDSRDGWRPACGLAALFFIWLASIKLCQYFTFQSHYLDLGQDANICWNILHGRPFFISYEKLNFLGDHFEPVLALCALGLKAWPSPAMLLMIQSAALALAVLPLFALARLLGKHTALGLAVVVLFIINPFLHLLSEFDFHPESLFIPAALWALLLWEKRRPLAALAILAACLAIKEDVALALAGFGLYAALGGGPESARFKKYGWLLIGVSGAVFAFVVLLAIPHFAGTQVSAHNDRYASLGLSAGAIAGNVARHPWVLVFRLLRWRVLATLGLLLGSAGFLPLAYPLALVPVLAACLHHLVSDYRTQYALASQYSAQTLPFLFYAALKGLGACEQRLWAQRRRATLVFMFICSGGLLFHPYYTGSFRWSNVRAMARLVGQVPPQASVAVSWWCEDFGVDVLAHLAARTELSRLAIKKPFSAPTADYALLDLRCADGYQVFLDSTGYYSRVGQAEGFGLWRKTRPSR